MLTYPHVAVPADALPAPNSSEYAAALQLRKMRIKGSRSSQFYGSEIEYNDRLRLEGIPVEAYDYKVNGRSPVEWVIEGQQRNDDRASGIRKDPNVYALETMRDPAYSLKLLLSAIHVSLATLRIQEDLKDVDVREEV